ncbi:MAG: pilus assembly protein N-terminal domain-containing protein [Caulobacterales bacterium]|uniref:pilus assembly protein N-terminal domain-containing protein n=1 Tax=Glycocaulis sp. TaxID=1969725 RepID=UPI003FA0E991
MKPFVHIVAAVLALGLAGAVQARPFEVPADHTALIRLPGDAAAIVIGNPNVADATLYDARTIFVTGRVFGRTNMIALDDNGRVLYTSDLVVTNSGRGSVQVYRNTERQSYVCAPNCEAVPVIGDTGEWFSGVAGQQADRTSAGGGR